MTGTSRAYEGSHPWLTFRLDLDRASPRLWILLGEAASKVEHLAGTPLLPEVSTRLHEIYLAKGAHATTAIEGNTLTEEQVLNLVKSKLELPPSQEYLAQEVENVIQACERIVADAVSGGGGDLSPELIMDYNRMVLKGLDLPEDVVPGEIRARGVGVGGYLGPPAGDCEYLLGRLCNWLNSEEFKPHSREETVTYGLIKAAIAHLYLAWIHPFGDGNGRTARLVELRTLISAGVPKPASQLLSNHYNQTRTEYYRQLDLSSRADRRGAPISFLTYAINGFVDQLREQIKLIREQQWEVTWENHVYDAFRDGKSATDKRQRQLVLELSKQSKPIPRGQLPNLTPELAAAYAKKTARTLSRDVNALVRMGLIRRLNGGYRAAVELIAAFLPERIPHD